VLALAVIVAGSAGAVLAMGLVPGIPGLFKPGRHGPADAGAPTASASSSVDAGAGRKALEALAGAWVGNGRELAAVLSGSDLEFRVKKPDQFPRQGYEAGEARFVLRATADPSVFTVEDRIRPVPPTGKTYDARSRGTCQEVWTTAGADPLHAHWDGTRLTVEFAKIEPAPANFTTEGTKVTSCIGLRDLKASKVVSVLTRP
jgi:serine/threonine-protein kinase